MTRRALLAAAVLVVGVVLALRQPGAADLAVVRDAVAREAWTDARDALPQPDGLWAPSAGLLRAHATVAWHDDDPATALAALRAAAARAPRDPDVAHDLGFVRARFDPRPPEPPATLPSWTTVLTPGELGTLALLAWALASWSATRARRHPAVPLGWGALAVALSVVTVLGGRTDPIVVARGTLAGRAIPDPAASASVTWPAGTELHVVGVRGGLVRVRDGRDSTAWVSVDAVAWPPGHTPTR